MNWKTILLFLLMVSHMEAKPTRHSELLKTEVIELRKGQTFKVEDPAPASDEIVYVQSVKGIIEAGYVRLFPGDAYSPLNDVTLSISRFGHRGEFVSQMSVKALIQYYRITITD